MNLSKLEERLKKVKDQLRGKFRKLGINEEQIQIKMNALDNEFLIHAFVNGKLVKEATTEERLDFYIRFLELKLND